MVAYSKLRDYFDAGAETQTAFAARVGISPSHLSKLVAGEKAPSLPVAVRIAQAAGVPVESLLPSSPPPAEDEAPETAIPATAANEVST